MQALKVCLEPLSAIAIGAGMALGNTQLSRDYVPGSVVRGAIASAFIGALRREGQQTSDRIQDPDFCAVFGPQQPVRFGFLYPCSAGPQQAASFNTFPTPLSAWHCKSGGRDHGIVDLLGWWLRRVAHNGRQPQPVCPECKDRLVRYRAYIQARDSELDPVPVRKRLRVRVGLNRQTETAEEQILYVVEAIDPPVDGHLTYVGAVWATEDQRSAIQRMLAKSAVMDGAAWRLRVGTAKGRGLGSCRLQLCLDGGGSVQSIEERLNRFQGLVDDPSHLYAALTLRSPLLVSQPTDGLPATCVELAALARYVNEPVPRGLEVLHSACALEPEAWGGWQEAWGLPKPLLMPWAPGGVISVRVPSSELRALIRFLEAAERDGLGERTAEGWGEVAVCDPFHLHKDYEEGA
jgi:CRISPR-associated protein Csx10